MTDNDKFFFGIFQVSKEIRDNVERPGLFDELLETAHALLGIVDGNIPDDSTIALAAKFLTAAAQVGYRSLTAKELEVEQ